MAYNPYDQSSGSDPRGRIQNQMGYQQQRYEGQIDPIIDMMGYNYARGSEANYGDYTDIMNQYRSIASPGNGVAADGGGGGGGGGAATWGPELISYNDPFNSYAGYQDFSQTGGYSKEDIGNLRARGTAPIRAAYANAEREVARQRALQGGYSPNAFALQGRMAREQGQLGADAMQNVEGGIVNTRNTNKLSGLAGMTDVEKQRLAADLDVAKFNANAKMSAASSNAGASNAASAAGLQATAASRADQLKALQGMTSLYGTTPAMASAFGKDLLTAVGQSGTWGQNQIKNEVAAGASPGKFDQTINRGKDVVDLVGRVGYPLLEQYQASKKKPAATGPIVGTNPGYGNIPTVRK